MKKVYFLASIFTLLFSSNSLAQVGISSVNSFVSDSNSILDASSTSKGVLLPRVALTSSTVLAPISGTTAAPNSLLIYNTATAGTSPNNVTPGFYYWENSKWNRVLNPNDLDLRLVGINNHITKDAGYGSSGTTAGISAGTGNGNIGIGRRTFDKITSGSSNIALGTSSLYNITTSSQNIAIGENSLYSYIGKEEEIGTIAIGKDALTNLTKGTQNLAIGYSSSAQVVTGSFNTSLGYYSLNRNIASNNTGLGNYVLTNLNDTSASDNTAIGSFTAYSVLKGASNTFIGSKTAHNWKATTDSNNNTFIGANILSSDRVVGGSNIDDKYEYLNTKINNTTILGSNVLVTSKTTETTVTVPNSIENSLFLGQNSGILVTNNTGLNYASAIGASAKVGASNSIVLGRSGEYRDNVGIGVLAPQYPLHILKNTITNVALYVDGDIVTTGKLTASNQVFPDYVFEKYYTGKSELNNEYKFSSLKEIKEFITVNHHLPGVTSIKDLKKTVNGYTIDISEMTVQQLEKIEELYLHILEQQEQIDAKKNEIERLKIQQEELNNRLFKLEEIISKK